MRPPSTTTLLASSMSATVLSTLVGVLAGYYIGKSSGMNTSETITSLKSSGAVNADDEFRPKTAGRSLEGSVVDLGKVGDEREAGESDDEEGSDDEGAEDGIRDFKDVDEVNCKMVFLVRTDLGMTKGKIAAQCGHATLAAYKAASKHAPALVRRWETFGQAKIALQVKGGEEELLTLQATALSLGLVAKVIHDAGRTQIAAGSATVCAIGPAPVSVVNQVTGHLKLL